MTTLQRTVPVEQFRGTFDALLEDLVCYAYAPIVWEKDNRWTRHIYNLRQVLKIQLDREPSLAALAADVLEEAYGQAVKKVSEETQTAEDAFPTTVPWTIDEVFDKDYLPPDPAVKTQPDWLLKED